jgi:hypothetical protein
VNRADTSRHRGDGYARYLEAKTVAPEHADIQVFSSMQEAGRGRNPNVDATGLVAALLDPVARQARRLALGGTKG